MIIKQIKYNILCILFLAFFISCKGKSNETKDNNIKPQAPVSEVDIKKIAFDIVDTLPHNANFYTQGLVWHSGKLYEGTGQEGSSILTRYKKATNSDKTLPLDASLFGEGITILKDKIYQITWLNQTCLVYNLQTMRQINKLAYSGEGWGLTNNDSLLIMSDGSATIRFISPEDFRTVKHLRITRNGAPVRWLNELELVDTLLYANIYMQDLIIVANINTGKVVGEIDISSLRAMLKDNPEQEVSNGIAYNSEDKIFYLTGKNWNKMFIIKLIDS